MDPIYSLTSFLSEPMAIAEGNWMALYERSRGIILPNLDSSGNLNPEANLPFDTSPIDDAAMLERPYEIDEEGQATIHIKGVLGKRLHPWMVRWFGMTDFDDLQHQIRTAEEDDSVEKIRYWYDTPGGAVTGLEETMRQMLDQKKPTVGVCDTACFSAGAFMAACNDKVEVTRSSQFGSIGTIFGHYDWSGLYRENKIEPVVYRSGKFKAPGYLRGEVITKEQRKAYEDRVMRTFKVHEDILLSARPQIAEEHRQGQTYRGSEAWELGMVDDLVDAIF